MKITNLSATVAVVALLYGAVAAHAQTMSGKGVDTSVANGYGAQLQLDEVKAQQVVNTTAITTQGEQLDDVTGRLDGIDGRLDQIVEQISDLSKSIKTIHKTLTQVTSKTETLETAVNESADRGDEEPQEVKVCADRRVSPEFGFGIDSNASNMLVHGTYEGGLSQVSAYVGTSNAYAKYVTYVLTFQCKGGGLVFKGASLHSPRPASSGRGAGPQGVNVYCSSRDGMTCRASGAVNLALNVTVR